MSTLLVAAIDFGTTYSGWAFSFKHEFERDPVKISSKNWSGGQLVSQKGPTCVLINPDGKTLDSFGYDAESKYAELALEGCHKQWYFFKRFKMMLFNRIGIERNMLLEDSSGKKLSAKMVFALSIQYLKDDLIETSGKRIADDGIVDSDIHWVLTVPAIWNDAAKQFMREAAQDAGITGDKLTICLEPEAASLFCRHLPVEKSLGREKVSLSKFQAGTRYLVLDAGGGTVDITVHEIKKNGEIREIHKATGGDWGGTKVDEAFENFLGEIFGKEIVSKFKDLHMEDFIEMFRDFEIKKRELSSIKNAKVTLRLPLTFSELVSETTGRSVKESVMKTKFREQLTILGDKIRIDAAVMRSLFRETIKNIIDHIEMLLTKPQVSGCAAIVMVGGFSESKLLQEAIQNKFAYLKIIVPDEAGLVVLKGAVIFGHSPKTIAERICKFTYGLDTTHTTSSKCQHKPCRREDGKCHDIFEVYVKAGQCVKLGEETEETVFEWDDQYDLSIDIYATEDVNPFSVDEPGCSKVGGFIYPKSKTPSNNKRDVGISFIFGGTEIEVKVVDKANRATTIRSVNFLG